MLLVLRFHGIYVERLCIDACSLRSKSARHTPHHVLTAVNPPSLYTSDKRNNTVLYASPSPPTYPPPTLCGKPDPYTRTQVYDSRTDSVVVSPFPVYVDPRWLLQMLALPDRQLLAQTSTSPEAEDDRFVDDIRAQFSYMVAQSGPDGRAWLRNVFGGSRGGPLVFPRAGAGAARGAAIGASEACQPACDR